MILSIVIPARDENKYVVELLDKLHIPEHVTYEVIIADGNKHEASLNELTKNYPHVKIVKNTEHNTPHGINLTLQEAKGQYIMLCGVRSIISEKYVERCIELLELNADWGCVGGRIIHVGTNPKANAIAAAMGTKFGMGINSFRSKVKSGFVDTVSVPIFKREVVKQIGLFDEALIRNQDDDYSYRIWKTGYKIYLTADVYSDYIVRSNYSQLFKQFLQYGFWKPFLLKKHKALTSYRQIVPPLFLIWVLLMIIYSFIDTRYALYINLPFVVYLILTFVFSMIGAIKYKVNPIAVLWAMWVMHVAYAVGYILGLFYAFIIHKIPDYFKSVSR